MDDRPLGEQRTGDQNWGGQVLADRVHDDLNLLDRDAGDLRQADPFVDGTGLDAVPPCDQRQHCETADGRLRDDQSEGGLR
jgi:hypothetical protein